MAAWTSIRNLSGFYMATATRGLLMRLLLRSFDFFPGMIFSEFRGLPPNDLRCRVGVGGRVVANQVQYLTKGRDLWMYLLATGKVGLDSNIIEIGPGCGRRTYWMRDFNFHGIRYRGNYLGIDIDGEMLEWCRRHFDQERFSFVQSTHASAAYINDKVASNAYRIPADAGTQDLIFGTSVFTHLLEDQVANYCEEGFRVLRAGGHFVMTVKCIDLSPNNRGNTYRHRMGNAYVDSLAIPEQAVGYESQYLIAAARKAGFQDVEIHHMDGDVQHTLIGRK